MIMHSNRTNATASVALVIIVAALAPVVWCYQRAVRWRGTHRASWPAWRSLVFGAGVTALGLGLAPVWGDGFTGHVIAHLLLGMLAPLLIVVADPLSLAVACLPAPARRSTLRWLNNAVLRTLSRPAIAWALAVLSPWVLWLSPLYPLSERHGVLHVAVHVHFILAGLLFATVVLGVGPVGRRVPPVAGVLLIALALPAHALLGLVMLSMDSPLVDAGELADQRRGAVIMWLAGDLVATVMLAAAFPRWWRAEQRRARQEDALVAPSDSLGIDPRPPGNWPARRSTQ